jgi:hypothetical protein
VTYTQRQIEMYIVVKESLRKKTSMESARVVNATNWNEAVTVFTEDMIVYQEVQRLGGLQAPDQLVEKFVSLIQEKSKKSGVPKSILKKVYNKGLAAWRGGAHRPGASQQSWAIARVNSFLTCGKTFYFPDHLLAKDAMKKSPKAREFWKKQSCKFKKMGKRTPSR